jgi:hypothetical protein
MHKKFWLESLKGRDNAKTPRRWEDNIKWILRKYVWIEGTEFYGNMFGLREPDFTEICLD